MAKFLLFVCCMTTLFAQKGILIPFYHYPQKEDEQVRRLIAYKKRFADVPVIVIINPNNGNFQKKQDNFAAMIRRLHEANISVVGYVYTSYAKRPLQEVQERIQAWVRYYKPFGVEGIFVDEVNASKQNLKYYRTIAQTVARNFSLSVFNPGVEAPFLYDVADIVVTCENSSISSPPLTGKKNALLLHSVQEFGKYRPLLQYYDYVYLTPLRLPNPWSALSSYLPDLFKTLQQTHKFSKRIEYIQ